MNLDSLSVLLGRVDIVVHLVAFHYAGERLEIEANFSPDHLTVHVHPPDLVVHLSLRSRRPPLLREHGECFPRQIASHFIDAAKLIITPLALPRSLLVPLAAVQALYRECRLGHRRGGAGDDVSEHVRPGGRRQLRVPQKVFLRGDVHEAREHLLTQVIAVRQDVRRKPGDLADVAEGRQALVCSALRLPCGRLGAERGIELDARYSVDTPGPELEISLMVQTIAAESMLCEMPLLLDVGV